MSENIELEGYKPISPENITENQMPEPVYCVKDILDRLEINIVKISSQKTNKYILYKLDEIYNYNLIAQTNKTDLVDDLVHYFDNYSASWYIDILSDTKNPTYKKGIEAIYDYLSYVVPRISDIINDPSNELIFTEKNKTYFNYFQSTYYLNEDVKKNLKAKDWSTVKSIIFNLCGNNEKYYEWVINWLSCLYQYPYYRFSTSILFIGEKGSGKGMFTKVLTKIFDNCCYSANSKDLTSNFNSQLFEGKLLLIANEIVDQNNKYQFSNDLKEMITEEVISVEKKFSDRYLAKNFIKTIFFSNSNQPIVIEEGDRRYAVFKSKKLQMSYQERNNFFEDSTFFTDQVEGFLQYLLDNTIDLELVTSEPIMTEAKQTIININQTDLRGIILQIIEEFCDVWVLSTDGHYYISYEIVYNHYIQNFDAKKIANNKWSSRLSANDFIVVKKTIQNNNSTYIQVPEIIVDNYLNKKE